MILRKHILNLENWRDLPKDRAELIMQQQLELAPILRQLFEEFDKPPQHKWLKEITLRNWNVVRRNFILFWFEAMRRHFNQEYPLKMKSTLEFKTVEKAKQIYKNGKPTKYIETGLFDDGEAVIVR